MRIIATAEAQGFGPASNLVAILRPILTQITFYGSSSCYDLLEMEQFKPKRLDILTEFGSVAELLQEHDVLISVMDSKSAILAKKLGLKVVYFDMIASLWSDNEDILSNPTTLSLDELEHLFSENNRFKYDNHFLHHREKLSLTAHRISDVSIVEEFVPTHSRTLTKSIKLLPVLDPILLKFRNKEVGKDGMIIGGGPQTQNKYGKVINKVQSILAPHIESLKSPFQKTKFLSEVCKARIVITPPGFSTIYELMFLDKIPLLLPAQNVGQEIIVKFLREYMINEQIIEWKEIIKCETTEKWKHAKKIDYAIENDSTLPKKLAKLVLKRYNSLRENPKLIESILEKQRKLIKAINPEKTLIKNILRNL